MSEVLKKETFIEVTVENFHDYVVNLTFSLQKYIDMFYNTLPDLYDETRKNNGVHPNCCEMSSFLYAESESIIMMKCKNFIFQAITLIQDKFDKLSENIMDEDNVNVSYAFSEEGYFYFLKELERVDWTSLNDHKYHEKHKHTVKEMCQFNTYMENKLEIHQMNRFTDEKIECTGKQLIIYLQTAYTKLIDTLHKMRRIADESKSLYDIVIITRKVINILLITYVSVAYIEITETAK